MTAPTLSDFTFQFKDDGVLLNGDVMPVIDVTQVQGLDSATFRTEFKSTEGQDGGTVEADFEDTRTIVLSGDIYGSSYAELDALLDTLKDNYAPSRVYNPFYFKPAGQAMRVAYCKCTTGFRSDWDTTKRIMSAKFQVTLQCGDPIIYGTSLWTTSQSLDAVADPGFSFPFSFPFDFGASTLTPGTFSLTNNGNRPAPFQVRLVGSFRNPSIISDTSDHELALGITIGSGDELIIDFGLRTVTLNGANRRGAVMDEDWFLLEKGDNQIRVQIEGMPGSGIGSGSATFTYYDAWR